MKDHILEKLNDVLLMHSIEEPTVLYLMIQIRKVLDHLGENVANRYTLLSFYCDWVAHINMDRAPARRILEKLSASLKYDVRPMDQDATEIIGFINLRKELTEFLRDNRLYTIWVDKDSWYKFRACLLEILIDCPLASSAGPIREFAFIRNPYADWVKSEDAINYRVKFSDGNEDDGSIVLLDQSEEYRKKVREDNLAWLKRYDLKLYLRNRNKRGQV